MPGLRISHSRSAPVRCIYCAFAARKQLLDSQRSRASRPLAHFASPFSSNTPHTQGQSPAVRYTSQRSPGHERRSTRSSPSSRALIRRTESAKGQSPWNTTRTSEEFGQRLGRQTSIDSVLQEELNTARRQLVDAAAVKSVADERGEDVRDFFGRTWTKFAATIRSRDGEDVGSAEFFSGGSWRPDVFADLKLAHSKGGSRALQQRIRYVYLDGILMQRFDQDTIENQQKLVDLRYPGEWFPHTRSYRREFHLHVGPTNSGKTYQALKRLESCGGSGAYAGPLRLLAHEIYTRMNAKGHPCYLRTGEERRWPTSPGFDPLVEHVAMESCTVEMLPLATEMEVVVIDEIQMIADEHRGWAWTQAVLGVQAKEIHLCGEERAVPLIQEICATLGEPLTIHRYERLSPLEVSKDSLKGNLKNLRKGDCIVSFSVMGIHALKRQIEEKTGRRVAVVYGSLPAETRAQQAQLFNDPDSGYDYLVASDAIGMGLNLAIKRVIFETVAKHNGASYHVLDVAHLKQIAGRAGRFRTAQQATSTPAAEQSISTAKGEPSAARSGSVGLVTTLEDYDLPIVERAMVTLPAPLTRAGIVPTAAMLERLALYFPPETPFSYILQKLWALSSHLKGYFVCGLKDIIPIADMIESVKGLTLRDRYAFCAVPASGRTISFWDAIIPVYARIIAEQKDVDLVDIKELPLEVLDMEIPVERKRYLRSLEGLHQALVCYMWLSYRFAGLFKQRDLAKHATTLTEAKIAEVLGSLSFSERSRLSIAASRNAQMLKNEAEKEATQAAAANQAASNAAVDGDGLTLSAEFDSDDIGLEEFDMADRPTDAHQYASPDRPADAVESNAAVDELEENDDDDDAESGDGSKRSGYLVDADLDDFDGDTAEAGSESERPSQVGNAAEPDTDLDDWDDDYHSTNAAAESDAGVGHPKRADTSTEDVVNFSPASDSPHTLDEGLSTDDTAHHFEPAGVELASEKKLPSFAAWRQQQKPGESQGSHEEDDYQRRLSQQVPTASNSTSLPRL